MELLPTSCRTQLDASDFDFIVSALASSAREEVGVRLLLADAGAVDQVLEEPKLLQALVALGGSVRVSPQLYFYVIVRHNLKEAGIDDIGLADYIAATLAANSARLPGAGARGWGGMDFAYHVDFLEALDGAGGPERFFLHVRCANHFLVMTGLFPKFLRGRARRRGAPGVRYYEGVARTSFLTAGGHPLAGEFAVAEVYGRLADCFGETRRILNRMAEEYLFLGA